MRCFIVLSVVYKKTTYKGSAGPGIYDSYIGFR